MKNNLILSALALFLFSCQKEIEFDFGNGGSGVGPRDGVLIKAVSKTDADSIVVNYTYDGSKRLLSEKITGNSQGIDVGSDLRIIRNSAGIITGLVQKANALQQSGIDSVITKVYYNQGASRYSAKVFEISLFGFTVKDSSVLVYDGTSKIIREDMYQSDPLTGSYVLTLKSEYTFSANGNLESIKQYDLSSGTSNHVSTITYAYDSRVNPLRLNNEALVIGNPVLLSANNVATGQFEDVITPANNITITNTYTYNSFNKPLSGITTQNPGNMVSDNSFYYQ
jgi:YD repeat-containing protein